MRSSFDKDLFFLSCIAVAYAAIASPVLMVFAASVCIDPEKAVGLTVKLAGAFGVAANLVLVKLSISGILTITQSFHNIYRMLRMI
jgi:hypothetical protein